MSLCYEKYLNCFENCIRSVRGICPTALRVIRMTTVIEKNCVFQALAVKMRRFGAISGWLCKCSNTGCVVSCGTYCDVSGWSGAARLERNLGNLPGFIFKV